MLTRHQEKKVLQAFSLAEFFEIDLTIKVFGKVIFSWHFPPKAESQEEC